MWRGCYGELKIQDSYRIKKWTTDQPFYFWARIGKSASDYDTQNEKDFQILGEHVDTLWKKTWSVLRKYEVRSGMIHPDLSDTSEK